MSSGSSPKFDFPSDLIPSIFDKLGDSEQLKTEAKAALNDTLDKFSSHFSSTGNMWAVFTVIIEITYSQAKFEIILNYTNQLYLILQGIHNDDTIKNREVDKIISKFKADFDKKDDSTALQDGKGAADWLKADKKNVVDILFLKIILARIGFPQQQQSWSIGIIILQSITNLDPAWINPIVSSLMSLVLSELNEVGREKLLNLIMICISKDTNPSKLDNLLKTVISDTEKSGVDSTPLKTLVIQVILKAIQQSIFNPKSPIPKQYFDTMREIRPTLTMPEFPEIMQNHVIDMIDNCSDTGYMEEMAKFLNYKDLPHLFAGDVVNHVISLIVKKTHPIESPIYDELLSVLKSNNGSLRLSENGNDELFKTTKEQIDGDKEDKFANLILQIVEICAGSESNFKDAEIKKKFISDFGNMCIDRLKLAVDKPDKIIKLQELFFKVLKALINIGFAINIDNFKMMDKFQTSFNTKFSNDEKTLILATFTAAVEKSVVNLKDIDSEFCKRLLTTDQFDMDGSLACAIISNIPFNDEMWEFVLKEVVWKESSSREDNIYRGLVNLASKSNFPRGRVVEIVWHRYSKLSLHFLIAWIKDDNNKAIEPEIEHILDTKYKDWKEGFDENLGLIEILKKIVDVKFLKDVPAELLLFFDLHEILIGKVKDKTFASADWVKFMCWQIIIVFGMNLAVDIPILNMFLKGKPEIESVKFGVKLLLDFPMEKGNPLELSEGSRKCFKLQLGALKGKEWVPEEIKKDIGNVEDNIKKVWG